MIKSIFFKKAMKKAMTIIAFMVLISTVFLSCKKKDPAPVDIRDQAIGNYDGTIYYFALDVTSLDDLTMALFKEDQDFSIAKNSGNPLTIDFIIDGEVAFMGSKITEASNGFPFDIVSQTFKDGGDIYDVFGEEIIDFGGTAYNGAYFARFRRIEAAFNITIDFDGSGEEVDAILLFRGDKK